MKYFFQMLTTLLSPLKVQNIGLTSRVKNSIFQKQTLTKFHFSNNSFYPLSSNLYFFFKKKVEINF